MTEALDRYWADTEAKMAIGLKKMLNRRVRHAAQRYDRVRDLSKLFPDLVNLPRADIIAGLQNALRVSKNAAWKGHWTGDGNRVIAIRTALAGELYWYGGDK